MCSSDLAEVLAAVAARNADGSGSVGAVVGATVSLPPDVTSATLDVRGPLLVPGIGAQGGTVADVRRIFGVASQHVLPSISRDILRAGPDPARLRAAVAHAVDGFSALA